MCVGVIFLICLLIAVKLGTGYTNQRAQPSFRCTDFHCSDFGDCGTEWIDFVSTSATCFAPNSSALSFSPTADDGFYSATNESFWQYNNFIQHSAVWNFCILAFSAGSLLFKFSQLYKTISIRFISGLISLLAFSGGWLRTKQAITQHCSAGHQSHRRVTQLGRFLCLIYWHN